ncbi:hypothetical protein KA012_01720 [Candidatus Woesebacteria bacterium]|nr:hypothetical protein [Candidatus Woesebacteria bacterium]MBP9718197.1 hypothetical protein [Candidatus Gracilibacteria bacterium]
MNTRRLLGVRKALSLLGILSVLSGLVVFAPLASASYTGANAPTWASVDVDAACDSGIIDCTLTPNFDKKLIRAEFVTMGLRSTDVQYDKPEAVHGDIDYSDAAQWWAAYASAAGQLGWFTNDDFDAPGEMNRSATAAVLTRMLGLPEADEAVLDGYSDLASCPDWSLPYWASVVDAGLMGQASTKLNCTATTNKLEGIVLMNRVAQYITDNEINVLEVAAEAAGTDVDALQALLDIDSTNVGPEPENPPSGSGLTVAMASDTPSTKMTLLADTTSADGAQALAAVAKFNFTAASDGDVKVKTVKIKREGISSDTDLSNLYLYDGTTRLAEYTSFSDGVITFTNSNGLFTVPAGTTKGVWLKVDVANGVSSNKSFVFKLLAATSVETDGATVSGSFPMGTANEIDTATVADLGQFDITNYTTFPATIDPDGNSKELWRFNLVGTDQIIEVRRLMLTVVGTTSPSDLTKLYLEYAGTPVSSEMSLGSDNTVTFDLSAAPIKLDKGQTKTVFLKGTAMGGTNRSFKFTVRKAADVVAFDTNYAVQLKTNGTDTLAIIEPTTSTGTSINTGSVTITKASDSPSVNVALGATNVTLAKFKLLATGEPVKFTDLSVSTTGSIAATGLDNGKILFGDDVAGYVQIGTTTDLASAASDDGNSTAGGDDTSFTPGNNLIVPSGESSAKYLKVVADVKKSDATAYSGNETVTIKLNAGSATAQVSLASLTTSASTANLLTVKAGSLTPTKNFSIANGTSTLPTGVKGATGVRIGSFTLAAGAGEGSSVTQIKVQDTLASATEAVTQGALDGAATAGDWEEGVADNTLTAGETVIFEPATPAEYLVGETYGLALTGTLTTATTCAVTATTSTTVTCTVGAAAAISDAADGITLASAFSAGVAATDTLADTFQNLRLCKTGTYCTQPGDQIGTTTGTLTDTAATTYTFSPASSLKIAASGQMTLDIVADVKSTATSFSVNNDANGIASFYSAASTGDVTSSDTSTASVVALQNVYLAASGSFSSTVVDGSTPTSRHLVMGSVDNELATFKFTAAASEDLNVTQLVFTNTATDSGALQNVKVWKKLDSDASFTQLGTTVNAFGDDGASGTVTFSGLSLIVPKNGSLYLKLTADAAQFGNATSGNSHVISLAASSVTAYGAQSGTAISSLPSAALSGQTFKIYRTSFVAGLAAVQPGSDSNQRSTSANDAIMKLSLADTNGQGVLRAALQANDEADGGAAGNDWQETDGNAAVSASATVAVDGTNSIKWAAGANGGGNEWSADSVMVFDFGAAADVDADNYSKASLWVRADYNAAADDFLFVTNATADTTTASSSITLGDLAANAWTFVEVTPTETTDQVSRYAGIATDADGVEAGGAANIYVDNLRFYNDSVVLNLAGSLVDSDAASASIRDQSGIVRARGYSYMSSAAAGTITFIIGEDIGNAVAAAGTNLTLGSTAASYDVYVPSATIFNNATPAGNDSVSATINLGTQATAGDLRWYDNAVTATSPITWVMPAVGQSTSLTRSMPY